MEPELKQRLDNMEARLSLIGRAAEQTRKYFLWSLLAQLALFLIPLVLLMLAIPFFLSALNSNLEGLL